jgi:hypothetical protein
MNNAPTEYRENSQAVQAHLGTMQFVIQRMASNSSSCKAWCIALVSAVLVLVADKSKPEYACIAVIPTLLFLTLDAYYLALEKAFRDSYNGFIDKLHRGGIESTDLYAVVPSGSIFRQFLKALGSFSVWPMYVTLLGMIYLAMRYVM